jgi:hypothetical protein
MSAEMLMWGAIIVAVVAIVGLQRWYRKHLLVRLVSLLDEQDGTPLSNWMDGKSEVEGHYQGRATTLTYQMGGRYTPSHFTIAMACAGSAPFVITRKRKTFSRKVDIKYASTIPSFIDGVLKRADIGPLFDPFLLGTSVETVSADGKLLIVRWAVQSRRVFQPEPVRENLDRLVGLAGAIERQSKAWLAAHPEEATAAASAALIQPGSVIQTSTRTTLTLRTNGGDPVSVSAADIQAAYDKLPAAAKKLLSLTDLEAKLREATTSGTAKLVTLERRK